MADLLELVMTGMGWNKRKAQKWFNSPNPMLGGATPNAYGLIMGEDKLEGSLTVVEKRNKEEK